MIADETKKLDQAIGLRIKRRRMSRKMTQQDLGSKLGISFQQVQKYENGANRIGAGKLYMIARILEMPAYEMFDEIPPDIIPATQKPLQQFHESSPGLVFDSLCSKYMPDAIELLAAFDAIPNAKVRQQIIELAQSFADSYIKRTV